MAVWNKFSELVVDREVSTTTRALLYQCVGRDRREACQPSIKHNSLCWQCLKGEWFCLCQLPEVEPIGIKFDTYQADGEALKVVTACPVCWRE